MPVTPVAHGLILCDYVIVEERTHKVSLIGTFTGITSSQVPVPVPPCFAYALLTDSEGQIPVDLTISSLESSEELFGANDPHFPESATPGTLHHTSARVPTAGRRDLSGHTPCRRRMDRPTAAPGPHP